MTMCEVIPLNAAAGASLVAQSAPPPKTHLQQLIEGTESLSFFRRLPKPRTGRDYWVVPDIDNYSMQWSVGTALGMEFLAFTRRVETIDRAYTLGLIVSSMVKRGKWTGVEMGFMRVMAQATRTGCAA
jgi:hypothetical protein